MINLVKCLCYFFLLKSESILASNIIQQYEFDLYKSTGALVQSSGVSVGSGEQIGTSHQYTIEYNFSGLEDLTSYYVTISATTVEGMILVETSTVFLVNVQDNLLYIEL